MTFAELLRELYAPKLGAHVQNMERLIDKFERSCVTLVRADWQEARPSRPGSAIWHSSTRLEFDAVGRRR
jgi:hypothetical protein